MAAKRRPRTRWVVVVTDETGGSSCFGPWRDYERARKVNDDCVALSSRYGGPGAEVTVDLLPIEPWPGIRAFTETMV